MGAVEVEVRSIRAQMPVGIGELRPQFPTQWPSEQPTPPAVRLADADGGGPLDPGPSRLVALGPAPPGRLGRLAWTVSSASPVIAEDGEGDGKEAAPLRSEHSLERGVVGGAILSMTIDSAAVSAMVTLAVIVHADW